MRGFLASALCLLLGAGALRAAGPQRPLDLVGIEPEAPAIEWKADWPATYEANKKLWAEELAKTTKDRRQRDQALALRLIHLLEELIRRFPGDVPRRIAAYSEIADRLADAGCRGHANHCLKRIVDEFPGAPDAATGALQKILSATADQMRQAEDGKEWVEYAIERIIALNRAEHLSESHFLVETVWRTRLRVAMENGRLWDAAQALEHLERAAGRTAWWRLQEAELLLAAGRRDEALRALEELAAEGTDGRVTSLLAELGRERPIEGPEFPRRWALEARWEAARAAGPVPELSMAHALLPEAARSDGLVPSGRDTQASLWAVMDRELLAVAPGALAPLRELQQREAARARISDLRFPISDFGPRAVVRNAQSLFALWRRCPWAHDAHAALMAYGEQALRRGDLGLAFRAFEDVARHSADATLRARAKAGMALALRTAAASAATSHMPLATTPKVEQLVLPVAPWAPAAGGLMSPPAVHVVVQEDGRRLFAAGPGLLACYGESPGGPLWWRAPDTLPQAGSLKEVGGRGRSWVIVPGPFAPAAVGNRVFTRWGLDASGQLPAGLAAFDAATGEMVWTTGGSAWAEGLSPISDPAVADGRLYVLAARGAATALTPVWLVCLDAADGALLWQRFLTSCSLALPRAHGLGRGQTEQVDLARYGTAPLVHLGAVYCSTNLGFVARCDARDGVVEWVRTYPRAPAGRGLGEVVRRQGGIAIADLGVRGADSTPQSAVVFAPRDYAGAFALHTATGALLWDAPFVPSQQLIGLVKAKKGAGHVLLRDNEVLAALDMATGRVAWHRRFPEGIEQALPLPGTQVCLLAQSRLLRLDAATGAMLEASPMPTRESLRGLALRREALVAVTDRLIPTPAVHRSGAPAEALELPLRRAWRLGRQEPVVWMPPAGSPLDGRLFLYSQGVLECLRRGADGALLWRRTAPTGVRGVAWAGPTLLLVSLRRVLALDGLKGERRWEAEAPFDILDWRLCDGHLLVSRPKQGREAAFIRLATGEIAWQRSFSELFGRAWFSLDATAWDGRHVHLLSSRFSGRREGPADLLLRPADGLIEAARPFPREGAPWPLQLAVADGAAFAIGKDGALHEYSLADGSLRDLPVELKHLDPRRIQRFAVDNDWVHLYWDRGYDAEPDKHWLVPRRGGAIVRRKAWGERRGDKLLAPLESPGAFAAFDLESGATTAYRPPPDAEGRTPGSILAWHLEGARIFAASAVQAATRQVLRIDAFNEKDGQHLGTQLLPDVEVRGNEFVWAPGALLVTDPAGLHCFVPASPADLAPRPVQAAYRLPKPLPAGSLLRPAEERDVVRLSDARDARGSLHVAHDEESLHILARYRDPEAMPWHGETSGACGDWLELGLRTNLGSYRWALGLDGAGKLIVRGLDGTALPPGLSAALAHDPAARLYTCQLAIPWKGVLRPNEDWRRIGLWATAWDDRPATGGTVPTFSWGKDASAVGGAALSRVPVPDTVYLDARTREQGDAVARVIEELPDLPASLELFRRDAAMRSASQEELAERCWAFIGRSPGGPSAEALLLETALAEARTTGQPAAALARAQRAGVPEPVRNRVASQLAAHLSQWVFLGSTKDLRSLLIELNGSDGPDEWGHRAYWGKPVANWVVPPREMGAIAELPEGKWHELRIPLYLIGLHDKPLCGINFCQQGGGQVFWDRTAIVADGKATVIIEDETPRGLLRGQWEWVAEPRHSGARAHTHPPPPAHYDVRAHTLLELDEPAVAHLAPPLDRPWLSQWVYLDPAAPPAALALGLHDGRGWAFRAVWGKRALRGRPMGPLPPPGRWHELRLPLAWTPFLSRAIAGIGFCHVGGRAFWDRTALVVGGKEQVLLDDDPPPLRPPRSTRLGWQSWVDGFEGGMRPVPGKVGLGALFDGHSSCIRAPHAPELDPPQLTVEAWAYLDSFALGTDTKQWVLNKNGHAWEDGYFGLTIYRDKVAADLNIGGGKDNRFEAWSEEGALKLRRWHHLAMTYDGTALRLYRDAELVAETAVNRERTPGRGTLYVGRWAYGHIHFAGTLDEVRLYNRALTHAEIQAHCGDPATLSAQAAAAVAAHWGFDAEAEPAEPLAGWQFVERPAKSGKKAHTSAPATGAAGHALAPLRDPVTAHLAFERSRAASVLQAQIPRLGPTDEAWQLFRDLLSIELPSPERRAELNQWFLKAFPGHPRAVDALGGLLDACTEAGEAEPVDRVLELTKDLKLPADVLYHYHRRHARTPREFVRAWQAIGPFPAQGDDGGLEAPLPVEADGARPDRGYTGLDGAEVRWRKIAAEGSYVNLKALIGPAENAVAYAAAWAYSDRERPAVIAIGSDDRAKVWLNRKVVLTAQSSAHATAGEFIAPVTLAAGWNELLLKVTQATGEWGFYFELLDQFARRPPLGLRIAPTPPEAK